MKTLALLALIAPTGALDIASAAKDGVIEMDMHVSSKPNKMLPGIGQELLNLNSEKEYIEKDLQDFFDIQIYSKVYIGSNKQEFDLTFDTGSGWLWVQHDLCKVCANERHFNSWSSSSFIQMLPYPTALYYGKGMIVCYDSLDQICLSPNSTVGNGCMENYHFKSAVYQEDLGGMATAGIVGLAPGSSFDTGVQYFVPSLYKQGAIKQNMFSMYIDQNATSKIQIGGYDEEKYAIEPIKWYDLASKNYWQVKFGNVSIGNWTMEPTVDIIMADTGTSLNMISDDDFHAIFNQFFSDKTCFVHPSSLTVCECTKEEHEAIPDIHFQIDGDDFVIPRESWYERQESKGLCHIKFMHGPAHNSWILGLNFFNSYYTVFDYEKQRLGFAKSTMYGQYVPMGFIQASMSKVSAQIGRIFTDFGVPEVEVNYLLTAALAGVLATLASFVYCMSKRPKVVKAVEVVSDDEDELKQKQYEIYEQALLRSQL